nr:hypothetical protein [Dickeya dadantii]
MTHPQRVILFSLTPRLLSTDIDKITAKEGAEPVTPFPTVTSWDTAASDHAAVWVELDIR